MQLHVPKANSNVFVATSTQGENTNSPTFGWLRIQDSDCNNVYVTTTS